MVPWPILLLTKPRVSPYKSWLILIHEIVFSEFSLMCIHLCCILGAGLVSKNKYYYGFFSAAIKLPSGLSSGVVVAFYVSSKALSLTYKKSHSRHNTYGCNIVRVVCLSVYKIVHWT